MTITGPQFLDEKPESASRPPKEPAPDHLRARQELPRGPLLFEADADAPSGLQSIWDPERLIPSVQGISNFVLVLAGMAVVASSVTLISCVAIVLVIADRSALLGILATLAISSGLGLTGYGIAREWRAYRRLKMVAIIRLALSRGDLPVEELRTTALAWIKLVAAGVPDVAEAEQAVRAAPTAAVVNAILRERVAAPLRAAAQGIGIRAGLESSTLIAVSPHASWDGVIVGLRGLKVIHEVARLYGLRPGSAVTLSLIRKVAWTAVGTAGLDLMSQGLADQVVSSLSSMPYVRHIAASIPGAALAGIRLHRLSKMAAQACCPVPV